MLKRLFWIAAGAAGALQADRWMSRQKQRFSPSSVTGTLLDGVNRRLERKRGSVPPGPGDRAL